MARLLLLLLVVVAGCQQAEQKQESSGQAAGQAEPAAGSAAGGRIGELTGLYESGTGTPRNQLCMVVNSPTDTRFGLVVWGAGQHSCSGSGSAERAGDRLRLRMAGDAACVIDARIDGGSVVLPDSIPDGCAYYCGARATMTGARFAQVGMGRDEAIKAKDLVGDPIC